MNWRKLFPDIDHRWTISAEQFGDLVAFFAPKPGAQVRLDERRQFLSESFSTYAAADSAAEPLIRETCDLLRTNLSHLDARHGNLNDCLWALGTNLEPDLVWLDRNDDDAFRVVGGVVCFPSFWALQEKMGRTLWSVHEPVPRLNDELSGAINRLLDRMPSGASYRRFNWGMTGDGNHNHHPSQPRRRLDGITRIEEAWVRIEHQLLHKLPTTHGIVFGIRVEVVTLAEAVEEPDVRRRLSRALRTMTPEVLEYKGLLNARDRLLDILRA